MKTNFDPNAISPKNGCFLGLKHTVADSDIVLQQAPWDVTTSYRPGTVYGPECIIEASYQLDMYSPYVKDAWNTKIATIPMSQEWKKLSASLRSEAVKVISALEKGASEDDPEIKAILARVNDRGATFHHQLYVETKALLEKNKKVVTVGGDHSVTLGPLRAYVEKYPDLSVLHIDAHADLREAYEGFTHSHASIMYNVIQETKLKRLVQVGIRDVSPAEIKLIESSDRIKTFFDWNLKNKAYEGNTWKQIADEIVATLSTQVYISFDIDGLDPKYCPNTGTPVPGGLEFDQAVYLFQSVKKAGKKIVGGDLLEVAPGGNGDQWDGNIGARALWQVCLSMVG